MPKTKIKFTKSKIDEIKFAEKGVQVIYWDINTPGLGLVVGARTKTFRLQMDVKDATKSKGYRTVKKTLGRYGDITLEQARAMLRGYVDQDGQAVIGERVKLKIEATSGPTGEDKNLQELVTEFYTQTRRKDGKERREKSALKYQKDIQRHYTGWLELTLKEVGNLPPETVIEKYQQIAQSGPMAARLTTAVLSAVLNYGVAKYPKALRWNPLAVLKSRHVNIMEKIKPRHECLTYDAKKQRNDFKPFYDGLLKMSEIRQNLFLLTLYTGLRNLEAASLRWDQVDLKHAELKISDTKNRYDLHVPLNKQAMAILKHRKNKAEEDAVYIFPAEGPNSKTGHAFMHPSLLRTATGLDITVHGLRRTFTTIGRKLKRYEDTSRLTNHIDSSIEGKHYDETDVEDLRETCQMIGDTMERFMLESDSNVIQFPGIAQAA
jgi:integrase